LKQNRFVFCWIKSTFNNCLILLFQGWWPSFIYD